MTRAGVVRAEGVEVTTTQSNDRILIQRFNEVNGSYEPRQITANDLIASQSGVVTLTAGEAVVSNTNVTADSRIFVGIQSLGTVTTPQAIGITARSAGTSFTITSEDNTDTSVIAWHIIEPA